jgi:serine protease
MEIIKKTLVVLILWSLIVGTVPISVLAQQNSLDNQIFEYKEPSLSEGVEYAPGEFIVQFKPGVSNEKIASINSRHGTSVKYTSPYARFKILHIPKGKSVPDMVEIYSKNPNVEYVVTNSIAHAFMSPNDPLYHYQWHLDDSSSPNPYGGTNGGGINIEPAWDISNGTGVVIAVLDTGVAYENYGFWYQKAPDLANTHFVAGWDFVNNDAHPNDDNSHGTHVTGTIAQSTNNGIGVAGVAFNCSIMPVKVLNKKGSGTLDQLVDGIYFATDNGADVISMSLGWPPGYDPGQPLKDALDYAYINGVTIISASGNDAASQLCYPAAYGKCIAVGATRFDETRASYSNYGDALDIMAPGGDLSVDQNGDGYGDGVLQNTFNPNTNNPRDFNYWFFSGTSMATPHVSGVAALLIANGVTGPDNVREALLSTAEDKGDPGWDTQYGWGIVDAYAALQWSATPNNPPVANDQSVTIDEDTTAAITLTATDPDGDTLTYLILSGPSNGVLTGTAPTLTYTPNADYNGADSFAFKANDGTANSNIATVNITVNPVNDLPVADDQLVTTEENTPVAITLTATDPDGDTLTYSILSGPSNGVLTGTMDILCNNNCYDCR